MKRSSVTLAAVVLASSGLLAACGEEQAPGTAINPAAANSTPTASATGATTPPASGTAGAAKTGEAGTEASTESGGTDSKAKADTVSAAKGGALSVKGLASAPYPAMCTSPAGRLKDGKDLRGLDGNVAANMPGSPAYNAPSAPVLVDLNHDGSKEMVVEFDCDAGGVTWPSVIVVYGSGWKVLGTIDLGKVANDDRYYGKARVASWSAGKGGVSLTWNASQGASGDVSRRTGLIKLRDGRPVITDIKIHTGHGAGGGSNDGGSGSALTLENLKSAPYPAMCNNPAGTLVNGKNLRGRDGNVAANMPGIGLTYYNPAAKPVLVDLTGDGRKEMVVKFDCDAGGVTWPAQIVVYGPGWKVLGNKSPNVPTGDKAEVDRWSVSGSGVHAYFEHATSGEVRWEGDITLKGGRLNITAVDIKDGDDPTQPEPTEPNPSPSSTGPVVVTG